MICVGLNGFGRIGRTICRINHRRKAFNLVAVNDVDPNVDNLAYLLKYDSTHGRLNARVESDGDVVRCDDSEMRFWACSDLHNVPWEKSGVDVLIDATGVQQNVVDAADLVQSGRIRKAIVTWSPPSGVDETLIFGVNETLYDAKRHAVVSASICDAIAAAPVLRTLDDHFGIETGLITTLHPWLSYQNLVDGAVSSVASPGHYWRDYSLGRASVMSLIPKPTTVVSAIAKVLPDIAARLEAMSFRVPTGIVACSDMTLTLRRGASAEEINELFRIGQRRPEVVRYEDEHLVSVDFAGTEESAIVDGRWTKVVNGRLAKVVLWYDNEWGYSSRVVDLVVLLARDLVAVTQV